MRQLAAYARVAAVLDTSADTGDDKAAVLDARIVAARMATAFANLDDDQRDALYLVAVAGLRYEQAAVALGCRVGTVHSRVARGRVRLRDLMRANGEEEDECHRDTMDRS
jgi:RNA polymerase sigma-70 factor (ECF subfamily)